jgi:hypothetical protein
VNQWRFGRPRKSRNPQPRPKTRRCACAIVGLTVAGIVAGAAKFRPGLAPSVRDWVDLSAYTLRGVGGAAALYGLLAADVTAWRVSIGGAVLGTTFLVVFWRATRPAHRPQGQAESRQHDQQGDAKPENVAHGRTYCDVPDIVRTPVACPADKKQERAPARESRGAQLVTISRERAQQTMIPGRPRGETFAGSPALAPGQGHR